MTKTHLSRTDGRKYNQLRPISFIPNFIQHPEGSVLISCGDTRVLCNLTIQDGIPSWLAGQGLGWMTAEYSLLPRSTHTRTPRETHGLKGRTQEIQRLIGRSLRMAVDLTLIGERTLMLDCDVIQADGGTRVASITGGYLALALGLNPLIKENIIPKEALRSPIGAISVGIVNNQPLVDLNYYEDSQAEVDLNIVKTAEGQFIEIQGTAESQPFSRASLEKLLLLADEGLQEINVLQSKFLTAMEENSL